MNDLKKMYLTFERTKAELLLVCYVYEKGKYSFEYTADTSNWEAFYADFSKAFEEYVLESGMSIDSVCLDKIVDLGPDPYYANLDREIKSMGPDELLNHLTEMQKKSIYEHVLTEHVKTDLLSLLEDEAEEYAEKVSNQAAVHFAILKKYDCNLSYWDNLSVLIKKAKEDVEKESMYEGSNKCCKYKISSFS